MVQDGGPQKWAKSMLYSLYLLYYICYLLFYIFCILYYIFYILFYIFYYILYILYYILYIWGQILLKCRNLPYFTVYLYSRYTAPRPDMLTYS